MLNRKIATIAVLIALALTTLGLRTAPATVSHVDAGLAYTTPADPLPIPISPPPH